MGVAAALGQVLPEAAYTPVTANKTTGVLRTPSNFWDANADSIAAATSGTLALNTLSNVESATGRAALDLTDLPDNSTTPPPAGTYLETGGPEGSRKIPATAAGIGAAAVGTLQDVLSSLNLSCYGDSFVEGYGNAPLPQQLAFFSGYGYFNGGIGGQTSSQVKDRLLADAARRGWATVIWCGRNNYGDAAAVKADIAAMVAALGHDRYLILGILPKSDVPSEQVGGVGHNAILALNADLAAAYGPRFFDVLSWLRGGALADVGITPTAQDLIDITAGQVPGSLRYDSLHLNSAGYRTVARKIVSDFWGVLAGESRSAVTVSLLPRALAQTGLFGASRADSYETRNTRRGWEAGESITTGVGNTLDGFRAGRSLENGNNNTIRGDRAGENLKSGSGNDVSGSGAMRVAVSASSNTVRGTNALGGGLFSGLECDVSGLSAGYNATTASYSTWHGAYAAYSATTASYSVALGYYSAYGVTTANNWTAVGVGAMQESNGSGVTAVGRNAGRKAGNGGVYLGDSAGRWETGTNRLIVDNQARADEAAGRAHSLIYGQFGTGAADSAQYLTINGRFAAVIPTYASDAAADADSALQSGQLYRISGARAVYQKP